MNCLQLAADVLLSGCGPGKQGIGTRVFVVLMMGIAGLCFLALAGFALAKSQSGVPLALVLVVLAAVCFGLVSRARRW